MVCAAEVYQWFKELPPFNRIDFLCSLMQLCLPSELRFFGTLLDDMNNKDYANLREDEDRSNSPNEFRQYPLIPFTGECVRKLCLSLSLLKSTNQKVGQIIYEILQIHSEYANECIKSSNEFCNDILLLYALASYHPAFTFENRYKIGKQLKMLLLNYEKPTDKAFNQNNSCCYNSTCREFDDIEKFNINIKDVKIDNSDADVTIEILTKRNNRNLITKRIAKFSKILELFNGPNQYSDKIFYQLKSEINNLKRNGNFNQKNIFQFLEKINHAIETNNINEDLAKFFKDFFLQLPILYKNSKISPNKIVDGNVETLLDNCDTVTTNKICSKYIFQNNSFDPKTFEESTMEKCDRLRSDIDCSELLEIDKCKVVSINKLVQDNSQCKLSNIDANIEIQDVIDKINNDNSINGVISDNNITYQDLNTTNMPVFQYYLHPYSVLGPTKPGTTLSPYQVGSISSNSVDHLNNSSHTQANKMMRSIMPETVILTHYPQRFLPFNPQIQSIVPFFCSMNAPVNYATLNDMNYELYTPQRLSSTTSSNIIPQVSSKLTPTSTPPRLQFNHQKSSVHTLNYSGS